MRHSESGIDTDCDDEHTLAHQAAACGDTQLLIRAIKHDPSVIQQKDADGYVPLAHAVLGKHMQTLKRLVKMGADVNAQDAQGRTCLAIAAYQHWSEGVVYLLRKGGRQDLVDRSGRTPLHAATYDTDTKSLLALLKRLSADDINTGDNERMTALHWAAFHNRPDHVRILLQKGADPFQVDIDGKTALHWAAQNGSVSCCSVLAEQCDGLAVKLDNCGKTAFLLSAAAGHATILHDLARIAPQTCETLDKDDRSPLHWAAATGSTCCVRALLNMGVVPNPLDVEGSTPLDYAVNAGHKECIVILRDRLGIKIGQNKIKKNTSISRPSPVGFFKGLFSKKKEPDKKGQACQTNDSSKLPQVVPLTNDKIDHHNSLQNGTKQTLEDPSRVVNSIKTENKEEISTREQGIVSPRPGGSKRISGITDGGTFTPTTQNSSLHLTDSGTMKSVSRGIYLSPLEGVRPPSISPRLSNDAQDRSPMLSRRLSPLRMTKERFEVPVMERVTQLKQEQGPRTPTPPPPIAFSSKGRAVLPEIQPSTSSSLTSRGFAPKPSPIALSEMEQNLDETPEVFQRKQKKKKKKKKQQQRELFDDGVALSPRDDGLSENSTTKPLKLDESKEDTVTVGAGFKDISRESTDTLEEGGQSTSHVPQVDENRKRVFGNRSTIVPQHPTETLEEL